MLCHNDPEETEARVHLFLNTELITFLTLCLLIYCFVKASVHTINICGVTKLFYFISLELRWEKCCGLKEVNAQTMDINAVFTKIVHECFPLQYFCYSFKLQTKRHRAAHRPYD